MKEKVFINHTNHAAEDWSAAQITAAENFGRIVDFPFPEVPPSFTVEEVRAMVFKKSAVDIETCSGGCTLSGRI